MAFTAIASAVTLLVTASEQWPPAGKIGGAGEIAVDRKTEQVAETTNQKFANASRARDDAALAGKVQAALSAEPHLSSTIIMDVNASNGVVTLSGAVGDPETREHASHIALSVEGVTSVRNRILVVKSS